MNSYLSGQTIQVSVPLADAQGVAITAPDSVTVEIRDEAGAEIRASSSLTATLNSTQVIEVTALENALPANTPFGLRTVALTVVKSGLSHVCFGEYRLEAVDPLMIGTNSYQTYGQARVNATRLFDLESWDDAARIDRIRALSNAYQTLGSLYFQVRGTRYPDIRTLDATTFNSLEARFRDILSLAQVIEANEFLSGDTVHKKRMAGLMSETIGESSMFFRPEKVLQVPVTRRSMDLLRNYIVWEARIGRG